MARRRVVIRVRDPKGNLVGGPNWRVRIYRDYDAALLEANTYLHKTGADLRANPGFANAGQQAKTTANAAAADDTVQVDTTAGFVVGDEVPIKGSGGKRFRVIKAILAGPARLQFHTTIGLAQNAGALVGSIGQYGKYNVWLDDTQDYDYTLENVAQVDEGGPIGIAIQQTVATLEFQEEGVVTSTRGKLNVVGPFALVTDDGPGNRATLAIDPNDEIRKWALIL